MDRQPVVFDPQEGEAYVIDVWPLLCEMSDAADLLLSGLSANGAIRELLQETLASATSFHDVLQRLEVKRLVYRDR